MREPTTQDIDALIGASTPHFAFQIRERVERLVARLPEDHPVRAYADAAPRRARRARPRHLARRGRRPVRAAARVSAGHAPPARGRRRGDRTRRPALRALLGRPAARRGRPALAAARRQRARGRGLDLAARGRGDRRARSGRPLPRDVLGAYPLDAGALGRIAGMHVWSERHLNGRLAAGEQLHAVVVRAWAAPQGHRPATARATARRRRPPPRADGLGLRAARRTPPRGAARVGAPARPGRPCRPSPNAARS